MGQQSVARRGGVSRRRGPASGLIGRGRELADLTRVLACSPALVLVEGEAGIGKSRLLNAYLSSGPARTRPALVACCPPFRQPQTLGPLTDALHGVAADVVGLPLTGLAGALRPLFPEWAASLPPAAEPAEDATVARHRVFRALAELIRCLRLAMVVVEDAHWADEATLEFLLYLASLDSWTASLVVTYRPEDLPARSLLPRLSRHAAGNRGLRLSLGPLDAEHTGALVSSMLAGEPVSAEFATFVHDRTEGVPLAVEELVKLMADRADLARRDGRWVRRSLAGIIVPPTVRDAVLERAGRLSPQAQAVLRSVAVLAEQVDETTLAVVSALPGSDARAGLAEALRSGLLGEDARGLVSFRHALAGQAVHDAIAGPDRRALHLRAGCALEGRSASQTVRLARHFKEAGETVRWSRYAEQAFHLALSSGDEASAAELLCDLIDETKPSGGHQAVRLLRWISPASMADPRYCRQIARSVRSLLDSWLSPPSEEAELRVKLAAILLDLEEYEAARAELKRVIPHLTGNPRLAARVMGLLGTPHDLITPASEHRRYLRRAAQLTSSAQPSERPQLLMEQATALLVLGEEEGWAKEALVAAEATAAGNIQRLAFSQLNSGDTAMTWGRYADSRQRLARALELAEARHYRHYRDVVLATQVHLDWFTGVWEGLPARAHALADSEAGPLESRYEAALVIGLIHAAAGARERAGDCLRDVLALRRRQGAPYYIMEPAAALARLLLADGRTEDALRVTEDGAEVLAAKRIWIWATDLVPARVAALAAAGRIDEAASLAAAFARGLGNRDAPAARAGLALCRALLAQARGEHSRAASRFGRAAAAWRSLPRPYDSWLALEQQARCQLAAGNRASALATLDEVLRGLTELGAAGDVSRVKRELRGLNPAVRMPGRRGYGGRLSPRELDVARLLVAGGTNREIGEQLFLSPKTVARHLDSAMRKLGVRSRTALAVRLVEAEMVSGDGPAGPGGSGAGPAHPARSTGASAP
jgi:DNA-binding CsgD family transcriptional regulator/tetratricopeptide (TPR) repeat protein